MHNTSKTVLVADEDQRLVQQLAVQMAELGLTVCTAFDARSAIECVLEKVPDLICVDQQMPAGEGMSVCEVLARDDDYSSIPIIALSNPGQQCEWVGCEQLLAYHMVKSTDLWRRVEPVVYELVDIDPPGHSRHQSPNCSEQRRRQ